MHTIALIGLDNVVALASILAASLYSVFRRSIAALHILQQDGYDNIRYVRWLIRFPLRLVDASSLILLAAAMGAHWLAQQTLPHGGPVAVMVLASVGLLLLAHKQSTPEPAKKPLKYTARAVRIMGAGLLFAAVLLLSAVALYINGAYLRGQVYSSALVLLLVSLAVIQAAPFLVVFANISLWPVQQLINAVYISRARAKISALKPVVIGITGSYGKTSCKYFIEALLSTKYRVLKTPGSFNTTLGVCRVINDELGPEHKIFVVEMGAYRKGDIRELAQLTHPQIGVLTAIGPQHLERFGTIENIEATKYELIDALPPDGTAVFNSDDPRCRRLADATTLRTVRRYGIHYSDGALDVWAENILYGPQGLEFTLATSNGERAKVKTRLLGHHNVLNILAAVCVALEMRVDLGAIAMAIRRLQPVPHRLELSTAADGVMIIDDAYNSNPVGALNALATLAEFRQHTRILVTPGMVELGPEQESWNEAFGEKAASTADYVILVGQRQTAPILRGLKRQAFSSERIFVVKSLKEARSVLDRIAGRDTVVLFENDLPDLYEEL